MKYSKWFKKNKTKKRKSKLSQTTGSDMLLNKINQKSRRRKIKYAKRKLLPAIKKIFFLIFILGIISYGIYYYNKTSFLRIKEIEVNGGGKFVNESDVYNIAYEILYDKNIILLDKDIVVTDLKKNFLAVKDIIIEKDLPETVKLKIEERVPLVIIEHDEEYLVDEEGYVLGLASERINLPKLKYSEDVKIGEFISKDIIPASSEIIKYANEEEVNISSMSFYPKYAHVYVDNSVNVFINNNSNKMTNMQVVKSLIESARITGRKLEKIDLRYDKVIVLYE